MEANIIKLTVEEAANIFKKSTNTIYYWTKTGKVKYEQGEEGQILTLTNEQYEKLLKKYNPDNILNSNNSNATQLNSSQVDLNSNKTQAQFQNNQQDKQVLEQMNYLAEKIKYFADVAIEAERSKVRLIEDSEKLKQDEYFKLKANLNELKDKLNKTQFEFNQTKIENKDLLQQIEKLKTENSELKDRLYKKNWQFWKK